MIPSAVLSRVDRVADKGRTGPLLAAVETDQGEEIEVFVKLSAGCDQGVVNLAREAIAACLAADLGLPIPRPYLVTIDPDIFSVVEDPVAAKLRASCPIAFGSTRIPDFSVWSSGYQISEAMRPMAAAILLFDAITQNSDRRAENPNCVVKGDEVRIFDHELSFAHRLLLLWKQPWKVGGMASYSTVGKHIFVEGLSHQKIDFTPIKLAWSGLADDRIKEYGHSLPLQWAGIAVDVDSALTLIADARDNIDGCISELERVLT